MLHDVPILFVSHLNFIPSYFLELFNSRVNLIQLSIISISSFFSKISHKQDDML